MSFSEKEENGENDLLEEKVESPAPSSLRLLVIILLSVFLGEEILMLFLHSYTPTLGLQLTAALDALILAALVFPFLYLFHYEPLEANLKNIGRAQKNLERRTDLIRLLQEVAVAANEAYSAEEAMLTCLEKVCEFTGWEVGHVYTVGPDGVLRPTDIWSVREQDKFRVFRDLTSQTVFSSGEGLPGRVYASGAPVWIRDVTEDQNFPRARLSENLGVRGAFAFPVLEQKKVVAVLEFFTTEATESDDTLLDAVGNLATQIGRVTERKRAEYELRKGRDFITTILDTIDAIVIALDAKGRYVRVNKAFEKESGLSPDEVLGKYFWDVGTLTPDVNREQARDLFSKIIAGPFPIYFEQEWRRKEGGKSLIAFSSTALYDAEGRLEHLVAIGSDITERKRMEEALRESEERYRKLVELSPDAIVVHTEGKLVYLNQAAVEMMGDGSPEQFVGRPVMDFVAPQSREAVGERITAMIRQGSSAPKMEHKFVRLDGVEIDVEVVGTPLPFRGRQSIMVVCRDITDRKKKEEERRRLATAVEQATELFIITDENERIVYINPAFENVTGYSREDVLGQTPRILKSGHHDKAFYESMWKPLLAGKAWKGRFINRKKDGSFFETETVITPIVGETGQVVNYVCVHRDVTREARLEKQIQHSQKMEAIGTMAGGIAHDFNNILSAIIGYTEFAVSEAEGSEPVKENLDEVMKAALRARDLVRQILAFSRREERELRPLNIALIIKETLKMVRAALPSSIEIHQRIDETAGYVMADPTQIQQVLLNLCANAEHAMRETGGTLEVSLENLSYDKKTAEAHPELAMGRRVKLVVSDQGHGMEKEVIDRIFEPFFTTKEVGEGTGLGLAAVHGIITGYGGAITVFSEPGKGTTFTVYLPQAEEKVEPVELAPKHIPMGRERLLFIDDEKTLVNMWRTALSKLGYSVVTATDGREALDTFRQQAGKLDLVITDYAMPGMTGEAIISEIRKIRPDIPIIICTGYSETMTPERANAMGIKDFVFKPILARDLAVIIRKALDGEP